MEEEFSIRPELENKQEERLENSLRPQTLEEYIGQTKVKENMKIYIEAAKTFVILFRNPSTSIIGYISRLMIEESVEYPHKYNSTGQASQSMIKQTAESIMISANDTYVKIGDGNITLNGETKVNGSLTLNDEDQGFLLLGDGACSSDTLSKIGQRSYQ